MLNLRSKRTLSSKKENRAEKKNRLYPETVFLFWVFPNDWGNDRVTVIPPHSPVGGHKFFLRKIKYRLQLFKNRKVLSFFPTCFYKMKIKR